MRALVFAAVLALVAADNYMMIPSGTNNRFAEANTNRNNANRLFDSQNNGKGGYCHGPSMTYYTGSQLTIQWTNQHGCSNDNLYCNVVLQYMCSKSTEQPRFRVRDGDGSAGNDGTDRIPNTLAASEEAGTSGLRYCLHESFQNRANCELRERNMGLFMADRESPNQGNMGPNKRPASFTRQNNNANRHGFECAEERDYYPYWHPSPWADIAILTHDESWCGFYKDHSENVMGKGYCVDPATVDTLRYDANDAQYDPPGGPDGDGPNNQLTCEQEGGRWVMSQPNGSPGPDCVIAPWTRDNHLGNGFGGYQSLYNWTIPDEGRQLACLDDDDAECNCVVRIRYNISQTEMGNSPHGDFADWTNNDEGPDRNSIEFNPDAPTFLDTQLTGLFYDDMIMTQDGLQHHLAFDTSQFGRTFQDRSFTFHLKHAPSSVGVARVYNLNVQGKRGNIVQAYPATEYDFVPNVLEILQGDFIHFQWTGCDTNPAGNAGEGTDQTDRSNIVQISDSGVSSVAHDSWMSSHTKLFEDGDTRRHMAYAGQLTMYQRDAEGNCPFDPTGLKCRNQECLDYDALAAKNDNNENNIEQDVQNCMKLNGAPTPYFDGGLISMKQSGGGTFWYMNSRTNNFTNRSQKGKIVVSTFLATWAIAMVVVGAVFFAGAVGTAGAMLYAKNHPHSRVAHYLSKL